MARVVCQRWIHARSNKITYSFHNSQVACTDFLRKIAATYGGAIATIGTPGVIETNLSHPFDMIFECPGAVEWPGTLMDRNVQFTLDATAPEKEKPVTDPKEKKSTKDAVKNAGKNALKRSTVRATNKALANLVLDKTGLSTKYPILLTKKGRTAFEVMVPIILHAIASNADVPKAEFVADALEESMTVAMTDGIGALTDELVEALLPFWGDVVAILSKKKGPLGLPEGDGPLKAEKKQATTETVEA